jgi:hypothetical protein
MRAALEEFDTGMSMRNSTASHGIPYSTFRDWSYGVKKSMKRGPSSVLS